MTKELEPGIYTAILDDFLYTGSKSYTFVFRIESGRNLEAHRVAVRRICNRFDYETYLFFEALLGHPPDFNRLSLKELLGKRVLMTVMVDEEGRPIAAKIEPHPKE